MKKKLLYIFLILIFLIIGAILILCPKQNSSISYEVFKARADISNYFNSIAKENYTEAVKYVSFFDSTTNETIEPSTDIKTEWIDRISTLAKKNINVASIEVLDVKTVNGIVVAKITLSVNDVGYTDIITLSLELDVCGNAGLFDIKYKVKDVTDEEFRLEIEDALSGIVK